MLKNKGLTMKSTVNIDKELKNELKKKAIDRDTTIQALIDEAIKRSLDESHTDKPTR